MTTAPATLPPIDWARETELAANNAAEREGLQRYRDLSSLSAEQLD